MKHNRLIALGFASLLLASASSAKSPIRLGGSKSLVIPADTREEVVQAGRTHLARENPEFAAMAEDLENPFAFEQAEEVLPRPQVAEGPDETPVEEPEPVIDYDDATVLKAVSISLRRQVRGTLARGDSRYMQLQGGSLMKEGTTFPARLPQLEGQTFAVVVSEIGDDGFRIKLNEASLYVPYTNESLSQSSSINRIEP